jgi:hypothetical protein
MLRRERLRSTDVDQGALGTVSRRARTGFARAWPGPASDAAGRGRPITKVQKWLIGFAGFLYAVSMHKFAFRDPLSADTGIQAYIETVGMTGAFVCTALAVYRMQLTSARTRSCFCFAIFGLFALTSSFRSFFPPLSFAKGVLFLIVLATCYLANQCELGPDLMRSIYWCYIALLVIGFVTGLLLPDKYPLITMDEYSGRTRVSVFDTFPGTLGEDSGLLLLVAPLIRGRVGWTSQLFLFLVNLSAGGKTSTALLCILLAIRFLGHSRPWRSRWAAIGLFAVTVMILAAALLQVPFGPVGRVLGQSAGTIYGTRVADDAVSFDGRINLWTASLGLLGEAQILGYGFDGAREVMLRVVEWSGSSHNGFLELGLSSGILGFIAFLVGLSSVAFDCLRAAPAIRLQAVCVLLFMLGTAVVGLTFNFPSYFGFVILIWLSSTTRTNVVGVVHAAPRVLAMHKNTAIVQTAQ